MSTLALQLAGGATAFQPGDTLTGGVLWKCDGEPESAEVRLIWFTSGKGTTDTKEIATVAFDRPQADDKRTFSFTLPEFPHSFSGKLITLSWAVELVVNDDESERLTFILAPEGREITLPRDAPG